MDHSNKSRRGNMMGAILRYIFIFGMQMMLFLADSAIMAEESGTNSDIPDAPDMDEDQQNMTPSQQILWAETQLNNLKQLGNRVSSMLNSARQEQDIIKITCLDDKLTQVNVTARTFEDRMVEHSTAVQVNNADLRDHLYRIMVILARRGRTLRIQSEGCIGMTDVVFGSTDIDIEIDSSITEDDTTVDTLLDEWFGERPPSSSPYL